ncbi:YALIA101S10e02938g1_1 [Yarrowia lipolytica]|nr:Hypothetical protein YALI2_A00061g [Yarrowia lipolytica]SEI36193.1 YALIA101S10e02938g1_1 [Yarrowia lipolytica]
MNESTFPKTSIEHLEDTKHSIEHLEDDKPSVEHLEETKTDDLYVQHSVTSGQVSDVSISKKKEGHLKLHRSIAVGCQFQVFLASHIVSRDVIGVTVTGGIEPFLKLTPSEYEWSQAALYFTYAVFVIPMALLFAKSNPRVFAGVQMFIWGLCCTLLGICVNYGGLTADRVIMGAVMSVALPVYLQVTYESHGRFEGQFVIACSWAVSWFMVPLFALIAIALGLITDGKPGWAWMFFITGICGCLQAPLVWRLLPDYFYHPRWIRKHGEDGYQLFKKITEKHYAGGNPIEPIETVIQGLGMALKDPIVWLTGAMGLFTYNGIFSCYGELMTVTLHVLKYSPALGQCIVWPILVWSCFYCLVQNWFSTKYKTNYPFLLANYLFAIIGWALVLCTPSHKNFWIKYGGAWFIIPNMVAAMPTLACWLGSNVQGRNRRLMSFAVFTFITNWYGVIVLRTWVATAAPLFVKAAWVNMAFMIAGVVFTAALVVVLKLKTSHGAFVYLL